jgi:hypothetical protein
MFINLGSLAGDIFGVLFTASIQTQRRCHLLSFNQLHLPRSPKGALWNALPAHFSCVWMFWLVFFTRHCYPISTDHITLELTNVLTRWTRVLLEKLTVTQLVKKLPAFLFMEPEVSLSCSQEPATSPYGERDASSPRLHSQLLKDTFYIILPSTPRSPKWSLSFRVAD